MDVDDNQGSSSKKRVHYKSYDPSLMEKAMAAVQHDGKTMYRAAKDCGVPMNTLRDRLIAKGLFKPKRPVVYHERRAAAKRKRLSKERSRPHIIMDDDMVERWRDIGRSEGLTSNAAITRFLVSLYYRAGKQEELKSDIRCQQCHNPLTLFCVNCHLISPSTPTSKTAPSETAADKECLSVTGRQSPPSKSALPPQADQDIKTEGGHQPTPSEGRSLRRKRLTRSCEKSKKLVEVVFSSEDEQPGSDEEDSFADDGWPQIEETLRVEDSNDNKEDPSYSLDDFLTSFEEQTRKKPRIKNHECPQCGETFLDILCLKNHFEETKHISEYICKQCDKPFKNKSALQQHGRVHNRQEHQCSICGLSFKFPSRLNKHIKTHGTDKPHICEKCGKSFVSVYYLRDHIKIHSEERRYKCDQCGAAFKQKPALYAHGKKHTNERPFQCQYCGLKFRDSQKVKIHVRTHTGEKPYKCDMCDASFVSNSNMWQHCAYVHGKSTKSHQCPRCPLTFAAKGKLKVHMKNAHGGSGNEMSDGDATSCQYEMMRQTVQSMYIEIPGTNQLVQI